MSRKQRGKKSGWFSEIRRRAGRVEEVLYNRSRFLAESLEPRRLLSVTGFTGIPEWQGGSEPELANGNTNVPAQGNPVSGAVNAVLPSPTDPNKLFIASVGGGIWSTANALATDQYSEGKPAWAPLTDQYPSESFNTLTFDPTDSSNKTIWAGFGDRSSGSGDGETPLGLLKSTDSGSTWVPMAFAATGFGVGAGGLNGQTVESIVPTTQIDPTTKQQIILVATNNGGVYRSNDGGATFSDLSASGAAGLPVGSGATSLVVDPGNLNQFLVAIPGQGMYRSTNNQGKTWTAVNTGFGFANSVRIALSTFYNGATDAIYAAVETPNPAASGSNQQLSGVFRSTNAGTNWTAIGTAPNANPGGQGGTHLALLADRTNPNVVYVAGDRGGSGFSASIFRGDASTNAWTSVVDGGANNTSPHADCRSMAWDAAGNIVLGSDGGVYTLTGVGTSSQIWQGSVGTLDVHEVYSVSYIPGDGFVFGNQDTGTAEPQIPTAQQSTFTLQDITSGDGNDTAVDSTSTPGTNYVYTSGNKFLVFQYQTFTTSYQLTATTNLALNVNGTNPQLSLTSVVTPASGSTPAVVFDGTLPFVPPYILNTIDPTRMLIGTNYLYEGANRGSTLNLLNGPLKNNLPDPTTQVAGGIVPFAYGGTANGVANASLIYAASPSNLYVRTSGSGMPAKVTTPAGVGAIRACAVDPANYNTGFIADSNGNVFRTTDAGATAANWNNLTGDLAKLSVDLRTLTVVNTNGKQFLFVGGANGVFFTNTAGPTFHWRKFGNLLPEVIVKDLHYYAPSDLLYAGTWGRGVWSVSKVSTYLNNNPTTLLVKGDNDSLNESDVFTVSLNPNVRDPQNLLVSDLVMIKRENGLTATTYYVDAACLDQIDISGGGGLDLYKIQGVPSGGLAGGVALNINVGTAAAQVYISNPIGLTNKLSGVSGPVKITGTAGGSTALVIDDQADQAQSALVSIDTSAAAGDITGLSNQPITFDGTANVGSVAIFTNAGGNTINVPATGVPTTINVNRSTNGAIGNAFFIGAGSVQAIAGPLTIEDPSNFDNITVRDQSEIGSPAITLDQTTPPGDTAFVVLSGLSPAPISFELADLAQFIVATGRNPNAITVSGPGAGGSNSVVVLSQPNVTIQNLNLNGGVVATNANNLQLLKNTLGDSSLGATTVAKIDQNTITNLTVSAGALQVTVSNNKVSGGITVSNASNVLLTGNTVTGSVTASVDSALQVVSNTAGSVTLTGTTGATATGNTVSGAFVLDGGTNAHLDTNTLGSLTLTGGTAGAVITNNTIVGTLAITGAGATSVTIQGNKAGIFDEEAAADGTITGNDFGFIAPVGAAARLAAAAAASFSITFNLNAKFTGSIDHNDIHNGAIGLNYAVPGSVIANRIFGNATGVVMPINDTSNGLGFYPGSGANDIFNNTTGVNLTGRMQLQHVYSNTTGITGSGILGGNSLDTANVIETNTTGVDFTGTIQFNRIDQNATAIVTHNAQIIVHNLIYLNTGAGVRTNGGNDVRIVNNTFYSTTGNNVQVDGGSSRTELLNNIFQADGGTDIYVADDSRSGFFSDYNDLFSTGAGKIYHYIFDFSDIIDVQRNINQFELHSIGTSAVSPGYAQPRFANLAGADFHIAAPAGGSHASSPTIDAADPMTDLLLPSAYHNLLLNPSFETGTGSWNTNIGATTQASNPAAFDGNQYFYAGSVGAGFAEQMVSLSAAGFSNAMVDSQTLSVVFGGRIRSAAEAPVDQGKLILTFLDGSGNPIGLVDTVAASNVNDRWELLGDRVHVPVGARSVKYRFESLRESGTTNDSYLDDAALYVLPDATEPDQGAYGDTNTGDINLAAAHIQLVTPQLYVDWMPNQPHVISWNTFDGAGSAVSIDLYQDVGGVPQLLKNITPSAPDTGSYSWIPQNSGLTYGTFGLRIQVSLVNSPSATDRSSEAFAIPENTHTYYVNDQSTIGDQYTTAIGSNRNTGRTPATPKPLLSTLFAVYALSAGDTIYVDTGTYTHTGGIVISGNPAIGNGQGVAVIGPTNAGAVAAISAPASGPVFDINTGNFVSLSHLTLNGAQYGVWVHNGSSNFSGAYLIIAGSALDGLRIESDSSSGALLDHIVSSGSGRDGISVGGIGVNLTNSIAHNNVGAGIRYDNSGPAVLTGNRSYLNKYGLVISNTDSGTTATVGAADLTKNEGNIFYNNATYGVNASGSVQVAGNTIYGTASVGGAGPVQLTLAPAPGKYLGTGTPYYYRVTAVTPAGETAATPEQVITLPAGFAGVTLTWSAVAGATGYNVYRSNGPGAESLVIAGVSGLTYTDTGAVSVGTPIPGLNSVGVNLIFGASATENVVYTNYQGIYSNGGAITNNRVFNNAGTGIYAANSSNATGNVSYSNQVGIEGDGSPTWSNNLLYANAAAGIWLHSGFAANILNNTIYQPTGDGIRVESSGGNLGFQKVNIRNNIVWTQAGYDITITPEAEIGFQSDYNDFYVTGSGQVGFWEGVSRPTLTAWHSAGLTDFDSISRDPLFVNPAGADGALGFSNFADHGTDDDFHEQSTGGSFHGGALAPIVSSVTGLPVFPAATLTVDAASSPAVDRGDPTSSFANEPSPNGGFINLGAFGNTAQASESFIPYVLVLRPNGGETLVEGETATLYWRSEDTNGTANLDLMTRSPMDGSLTFVTNIATNAPNSGSYSWLIPSSIAPGGNYVLRVTRNTPSAIGYSAAPFAISGSIHTFYVNDATFQAGDFTTAPGNDANSGLDPAHPKASIQALLEAYNLGAGDVIDVDQGTYTLSSNIVIAAAHSGVTIRGFYDPANPTHVATINRNSTVAGSYVFDIQAATGVTLDHLTVVGGDVGVNAADNSGSANLTVSNSEIDGSATDGIYIGAVNAGAILSGNRVHDITGGYRSTGIYVRQTQATIAGNTVYDEPFFGINVETGNNSTISGNTVYNDGTGINADTVTISGNIAYNNPTAGIVVSGTSMVTGNTTYNDTGSGAYPQAGIEVYGGTVQGNISYGNNYGVVVFGSGTISNNRLYNNSIAGISGGNGSTFSANVIYGNGWGIQINSASNAASRGPGLNNNLIYGNTSGGIQLIGGDITPIDNNTIYQTTGDAIDVYPFEGSYSTGVDVRNNILWVTTGYDIRVDPNSQAGTTVDFNDLYTTGTGKVGLWQNLDRNALSDWQLASLQDGNSISADPLFVNASAGDFHEQSLYGSFHGGSLAPVLNTTTGLPMAASATLSVDAAQSPGIDLGDPTSAYANEPAPNGGYVNLGAFGNTAQASESPTTYVLVTKPNGGENWIDGQTFNINWRTDHPGTGVVDIDLMHQAAGGALTLQASIATAIANSGQYAWAIPNSIPAGSDYVIRVTREGAPATSDISNATFNIAAATHVYYVNDATVLPGDWTSAPGNDANSGIDPAHPKASITGVLSSYTLGAGDVIKVDKGTYNLNGDIVLKAAQSGIVIQGYNDPSNPAGQAVLNRGNTTSGADFTLDGAANVTIDHLGLTGGLYGLQSTYQVASNNATLSNCDIYGNSSYGVYLLGGGDNFTMTNCKIHNDDQGITAQYVSNLTITNNVIHDLRLRGISISSTGGTISGNEVYNISGAAAIEADGLQGGLITVSNNRAHDNGTTGIILGSYVLGTGNTTYNQTGNAIGIQVSGGEARGNISYNNYYGIAVYAGLADQNRVYNNSFEGLYVGSGATVSQNQVYSNATGVQGDISPNIFNNLIYANSTRGILISNGVAAQIFNNTVYQPAGDAIDLTSSEGNFQFQHMVVSNNILWAKAGYDLNLTDDATIGFKIDYNDLYTSGTGKVARISTQDYPALSDWLYEYGFDTHSISADPQFVNVNDASLGYSGGTDHGLTDSFHLQPASPAIDAGDPVSLYFNEPAPNGSRINLGNFGNTPQADPSPAAQSVQITAPSNLQKLEAGHQYNLTWQTAGVTASQPVLLIDSGGAGIGRWAPDTFSSFSPGTTGARTVSNSIDLTGVTNPAPQQVYQSYILPGFASELSYQLPVADGSYTLRLHFMDEVSYIGKPVFNIKINGVVVKSNYDLYADAGAAFKATALSFPVVASGGKGLLIELVGVSGTPVLSGIELTAANATPVASPTANLQISTDSGTTWTTIAANQPIDAYGQGSYLWTAGPQTTTGPTALFRVTINNTALSATSTPFAIYNGGTDYYVNDSSQTGDVLTTAVGNNANTGKSPSSPLADIQAVLSQYNPGAGAMIHVDTGTYSLVHDIILTAANSGLTIQAPTSAVAVINRANGNNAVFNFAAGASNITLDHLSITGGSAGVYSNYGFAASNDTISNNQIFGNSQDGILLGSGDNGWTITGNSIHDNSSVNSFTAKGIDVEGSQAAITNNKVFNEAQQGIYVAGISTGQTTISGNETYADGTGIQATYATISSNLVHDNSTYGIYAGAGAPVIGNTVYRQTASGADGIVLTGTEARSNVVYYNYNGIAGSNNSNTIDRNSVYSNTNFGITLSYAGGGVIENLVYANSAAGIVFTNSGGEQIADNTVYQLVGDALRFTASPNASVHGNILWVEAGSDLNVSSDSQGGFVSDYNDLYHGTGASANVGSWGGTAAPQLAAWQAASSQDANSIAADPKFVNVKGADQVLGYNPAGVGYNGGVDDNFYLSSGSPAIDRGYSWAGYNTDILNQPRADDPGTPNAGSPNYVPADTGSSQYALTGIPQNWRSTQNDWIYTFPASFSFPFYGVTYSKVTVSSNGFLQFAGPDNPYGTNNTDAGLIPDVRIAPFWGNIRTDQTGNDIYVDTSVAGQIKFTWKASNSAGTAPVNFSAVLFSNGQIRFDYGAGNAGIAPTVGISMGDGIRSTFLTYDNSANLNNANSVLIGLPPGFVDMGAYEFQGSSTDKTSPIITATTPSGVGAGGTIGPISQVGLTFSKPLNVIDAAAPQDYQLIGAGPDGLFGTADDVVYALMPQYAGGSATLVNLNITGGLLPAGLYRLTAFSTATASIHDLSGNPLAGDGVNAGTNYVTTFPVSLPTPHLLSTAFGNGTTLSGTQRSEVRDIILKFDQAITLGAGAVTLGSYSGNDTSGTLTDASVALGTPTTSDGGFTWVIAVLANTAFSDATGSLKDGIYKVTIDPSKVTGGTLSGTNLSTTFHRLYGDIDGNKTVNSADYFKFKAAFGSTSGQANFNSDFDFDGNGKINSADYFKFKANFGRKFTY